MNLCSFCFNNSINFIDPFGEEVITIVGVTVAEAALCCVAVCLAIPDCREGLIALVKAGVTSITDCREVPRNKRCRPCSPKVGTPMFRIDTVPPSRPHRPFTGTHTHHYAVSQSPLTSPKPCYCYKTTLNESDGISTYPSEIPEQAITGGGVEYY